MISLTVALPIYNSREIAWLPLESLCNQKGVDFEWELLIAEEEKKSFGIENIKPFIERLKKVGCVSVRYFSLDYKIPLPQKWKMLGEKASDTSEAFVFCAADDYYPPTKLKTALKAIKKGYDWVAYTKYLLYDLNSGKNIIFNAESIKWKPGNLIATKTKLAKQLPEVYINKGVDKWLFNTIKPENIYYDNSEDWKKGFCTDGLNNISLERKTNFNRPLPPFFATDLKAQDIYPIDLKQKVDVSSHNIEFGYELISTLPYAYSLHKKGMLGETTSAIDTECLYFFSKKHNINTAQRGWENMKAAKGMPNLRIHRPTLDWHNFEPPPLKNYYKNDRFIFEKPIVCICNRINVEWGKGVINYFDYDCLESLLKMLYKKYQIIYFNIEGKEEYYDGAEPISINEGKLVRKYGIHIADLSKENKDLSFNTLQLMIMANCKAFITMNGGYSILASYFGGTNIIYSKECREIEEKTNSFHRWYHKFGKSRIEHVETYKNLFIKIDEILVKKQPLINIIVRSHNRPDSFRKTFNSIKNQTYKNTQVIAGADNDETDSYLIPYKCKQVRYEPNNDKGEKKEGYGIYFPYNHYVNVLKDEITEGYFMGLDDDDQFLTETALETIVSNIDEDTLLIWRVDLGKIIPSDENFGKNIVCGDISGIGFMCHIKHIKDYQFEPYRRSDYRVIKYLSERLNVKWINEVLTGSQNKKCNYGKKL